MKIWEEAFLRPVYNPIVAFATKSHNDSCRNFYQDEYLLTGCDFIALKKLTPLALVLMFSLIVFWVHTICGWLLPLPNIYNWYIIIIKKKKCFKNELKRSKSFDLVTDDVMVVKELSGRTLLSREFSLPCDKRVTLYSPRPSLPTFPLMFITPLNFKCRTSTGYFQMPHKTKTSNMLFVFNSLVKPCHSNKKT